MNWSFDEDAFVYRFVVLDSISINLTHSKINRINYGYNFQFCFTFQSFLTTAFGSKGYTKKENNVNMFTRDRPDYIWSHCMPERSNMVA